MTPKENDRALDRTQKEVFTRSLERWNCNESVRPAADWISSCRVRPNLGEILCETRSLILCPHFLKSSYFTLHFHFRNSLTTLSPSAWEGPAPGSALTNLYFQRSLERAARQESDLQAKELCVEQGSKAAILLFHGPTWTQGSLADDQS